MKLTRNSLYFIVITIIIFIAGWNTRANLLFFIGYLLVGIFIIAIIFSARNLKGLNVQRKTEPVAFQNQVVDVELKIDSVAPRLFLLIKDKFLPAIESDREKNFFIYSTKKDESIIFRYSVTVTTRGRHMLGPSQVTSLYPFLLVSRNSIEENYTSILIYPEISRIMNFPTYEQILTSSSNKIITTIGGSNEFYGIREYQSGDSIRIIDWKVSARFNKLVVKEFEKQLGHSSYIILDINSEGLIGSGADSNFERSINITASIIKNRIDNNDNIGMIWGRDHIFPSTGHEQLYAILNNLALLKPDKMFGLKDSFEKAENLVETESVLIIICKKWKKEYTYYMNLFRAKKVKVIFIYLIPESYLGSVSRMKLRKDVEDELSEIALTGVKLYPYFKEDLISEIFNQVTK